MIEGHAELLLFEKRLERFRAHKLLRERGRQRTDSTHVLAAIHALNRLSCPGQTFRHALNALATVAPEWLRITAKPEWTLRYGQRFDVEHEVKPSKTAERDALERAVAADGLFLLRAAFSSDAPSWLREIPVIGTLWRVWIQNFTWADTGAPETTALTLETGKLRFRTSQEIRLSRAFIGSPFDEDARYCVKRSTGWTGYKEVIITSWNSGPVSKARSHLCVRHR